jgi:WD40 repeat protein
MNTETGLPLGVLAGHEAGVVSLAFSQNGKWLISGGGGFLDTWCDSCSGEQSPVRVWDVEHQTQNAVLHGGYEDVSVRQLGISSDNQLVIATSWYGGADENVTIWDWEKDTLLDLKDDTISYVEFSPTDPITVIVSNDYKSQSSRADLWDLRDNTRHPLIETRIEAEYENLAKPLFSPLGDLLFIPGYVDPNTLWNTKTGEQVASFAGAGWSNAAAFTSDGSLLAYVASNNSIDVYDLATGKKQTSIITVTPYISPIFFSVNGSLIFFNGDLWKTLTGVLVFQMNAGTRFYTPYADLFTIADISPDGKLIAFTYGGGVRLWGVPRTN